MSTEQSKATFHHYTKGANEQRLETIHRRFSAGKAYRMPYAVGIVIADALEQKTRSWWGSVCDATGTSPVNHSTKYS